MIQTKTWADAQNKIQDLLIDANFASDNTNQILRAFNNALDDINAGFVGSPQEEQVGYEFQREIQDVLFTNEVKGTATTGSTSATLIDSSATFSTTEDVAVGDIIKNDTDGSVARVISIDSATQLTTSTLRNGTDNTWTSGDTYTIEGKGYAVASSWNYKFPLDLRLAEDSEIEFEYYHPADFNRKKYVDMSPAYIYTIETIGNQNIEVIKINYSTTEALYFEFCSYNIVKDSSGARGTSVANDTDILLIPDNFFLCPVELALADLFAQLKGRESAEAVYYLNNGRNRLRQMINSIGIKMKKPINRLMIRNHWPKKLTKITSN